MRLYAVDLPDGLRVFLGFVGETFEVAWHATFPVEEAPQTAAQEIPLLLASFEAAEYFAAVSQQPGIQASLFRSALSSLLTAAYHMERLPGQT